MSNLGQTLLIPNKSDSGTPISFFMDSSYDSIATMSVPNATGFTLHDHVLTATIPAAFGVDATTLRVVETTTQGGIDAPHNWRYALAKNVNRMRFLPAKLSGTTLTFKTLGKWANGVTRTFALYWDTTLTKGALDFHHLGSNPSKTTVNAGCSWTITVASGTAGDHYTASITDLNGTTACTYDMVGGDTTTVIATGLKNAINASAGTKAVATSATNVVTITRLVPASAIESTNGLDVTFAIANTGSTVPGNVVIVTPVYFGLSRIGPDTDVFTGTVWLAGLPLKTGATAITRPGWGHDATKVFKMGSWSVNAVSAANYSTSVVTSVTSNGPTITATGTCAGTRSEWSGAWTAEYRNIIYTGRKSDDTGAETLNKYVNVWRLGITYTCDIAYTPSAVLNTATAVGSHELFSLSTSDNAFGGNVTELGAGSHTGNALENFYADVATGTLTYFAASADLSALTPASYILGHHGNAIGFGFCLASAPALTGFGSQAPQARIATNANPFSFLHLRNLVTSSQIPQGARVAMDVWVVMGHTASATTIGDNLLPDEVVEILRGLTATQPTVSVSATRQRYGGTSPLATMKQASTDTVAGLQWFVDNAATKGSVANGHDIVYGYDLKNLVPIETPMDQDGNMGGAHAVQGLALRYLRTHESSLIAKIERQVQYHIDIEADAVAAYGSWWSGSAPYCYINVATASMAVADLTTEGGINGGDQDPAIIGAPKTISYAKGDVRAKTSSDQMHICTMGLWSYLYLLRNEPAITANTTLQTNALALLSRMSAFEVSHFTVDGRIAGNAFRMCSGLTPNVNNGIDATHLNTSSGSALANPYHGDYYPTWQESNTTITTYNPSVNSMIDSWVRAILAPDSVRSGVSRFMTGRVYDMLIADMGHHEVSSTTATWGVAGELPKGWGSQGSATGNNLKYNAGRSGDKHYIEIGGSARDEMHGRTAQRFMGICLAALLDSTAVIPIETDGAGNVIRSVPILTVVDQLASTCATYLIEETSKATRGSAAGFLGGISPSQEGGTPANTQNFSKVVDASMTGYMMVAMELAIRVKTGAAYTDIYPAFGGPY